MFVITDQQRAAFRARGVAELHEALLGHVLECFPGACAALGADSLASHVGRAMGRAEAHGLTLERDICTYVELTIVFGLDFERDAPHGWAGPLLESKEHDPSARIRATFAGALAALAADP